MRRLLPLYALLLAGPLAAASTAAAQSDYDRGAIDGFNGAAPAASPPNSPYEQGYYNGQDAGMALGAMQENFNRFMDEDKRQDEEYWRQRDREDQSVPIGGMSDAEYQINRRMLLKCFPLGPGSNDFSAEAVKRRTDCMSSEEAKHANEIAAARAATDAANEARREQALREALHGAGAEDQGR
jgi:hypothetical protein